MMPMSSRSSYHLLKLPLEPLCQVDDLRHNLDLRWHCRAREVCYDRPCPSKFPARRLYLSMGGEDVIEAIAFGARWPTYIHIFIG